jgi:hypothetical protein
MKNTIYSNVSWAVCLVPLDLLLRKMLCRLRGNAGISSMGARDYSPL